MKPFETFTTAIVSTAHLPLELAQFMDHQDPYSIPADSEHHLLVFEKLNYGFRVWIDSNHIPAGIAKLITAAKADGHKWIEFDCDADSHDDFPTYDW